MKGWKTIIVAVIMVIIGAVKPLAPEGVVLPDATAVEGILDSIYANWEWVMGLAMLIMRAVTDSPIFKKKQ